jgi:hypothetical protein
MSYGDIQTTFQYVVRWILKLAIPNYAFACRTISTISQRLIHAQLQGTP